MSHTQKHLLVAAIWVSLCLAMPPGAVASPAGDAIATACAMPPASESDHSCILRMAKDVSDDPDVRALLNSLIGDRAGDVLALINAQLVTSQANYKQAIDCLSPC